MAIDIEQERLYVVDLMRRKILSLSYLGDNVRVVRDSVVATPDARVTFAKGKLYWTSHKGKIASSYDTITGEESVVSLGSAKLIHAFNQVYTSQATRVPAISVWNRGDISHPFLVGQGSELICKQQGNRKKRVIELQMRLRRCVPMSQSLSA